jgi:hypothetical protein
VCASARARSSGFRVFVGCADLHKQRLSRVVANNEIYLAAPRRADIGNITVEAVVVQRLHAEEGVSCSRRIQPRWTMTYVYATDETWWKHTA